MLKFRRFLLALFVFSFFITTYSQQTTERKQLFDSNWKFYLGDPLNAHTPNFDDSYWRELDLPHDWSIEGQTDPKNPMGNDGGYFPAGIGWYRKTFTPTSEWKDKKITIYFEGVYMNSEVFINGKSLGIYPYGYTSFGYDLTPYIDLNKENSISVRVDNAQQKNSRWYSGSGIYRHVWMIVTNPVHITNWGTAISTPEVSSKKAIVKIKTTVRNETASPQNMVLKTKLQGKNKGNAGDSQINVMLAANSEKEVEQTITVSKPELWSPETPNLYSAQIQILKGKEVVDNTKQTFGIRSIKFTPEDGFQLNGKPVILNGGCVHHDNGSLGAAAYDRAEERKVKLLKSAGFNAVRTAHNPSSEAFLDACDKYGLFVIDECFDGWRESKTPNDYAKYFDAWSQRDLKAMVLRDRNHPSIIMWSIGNEIIERTKPEAVETAKMLVNTIKSIDTSRPVTSAMTTWGQGWEIFDPLFAVHDIGGYNYQLHEAPSDHERVPSRIIVQTESYPKDAFANWNLTQNNKYIIGDFVWTAIDYLGESGIGRYYYPGETEGEHYVRDHFPYHGAYCGDIDLIGWRKPISHYRDMLYNGTEKIYLAVKEPNPENGKIKLTDWSVWPTWESWTWPGHEGKDIEVEVYSRYPKVRLYLNKKLIGEQSTTKEQEFKANFTLPYSSGELTAVGVKDNNEIETTVLRTSGNPSKIRLIADRTQLVANGQDLSFITIEVIDTAGTINPNAENQLQFDIDGPGVIMAVDNANLKDTDLYVANKRKAWKGKAMVIIKSTSKTGDIKLTVSSPELKEATIHIKSVSDK